jgi:GTP cyclohydrolase II
LNTFQELITRMRADSALPFVTLSYAQSLDGSISLGADASLPLSGRESLEMTHRIRARHDAILVGIGTVIADDPRLSVRLHSGDDPQPIVLDSQLRFPTDAQLLASPTSPWILAQERAPLDKQVALESAGARVLRVASAPARGLHLPTVLSALRDQGIRSVMVEGGARVITSFLRERLVDLLIVTIAPVIVGGLRGVESPVGSAGEGILKLEQIHHASYGPDLVIWGPIQASLK